MASQSQLGTWKVFLFAAYSATQQLSFSALVPRERSKYPTQKRPGSLRDIISHNLDSKLSPNCPKFTEIHDKKIQQNSLSCCHQLLSTTHALRPLPLPYRPTIPNKENGYICPLYRGFQEVRDLGQTCSVPDKQGKHKYKRQNENI